MFLLGASYYFYMSWKAEYILLIVVSTLIDYFVALEMGRSESQSRRKKLLFISILSNLGFLFAFKYFNFFNDSVRSLFDYFNIFYGVPAFQVLLPVGISFYTFQTLSYSIDVYRGVQKPEHHLGIFALYVSFFPQLVAGPIERSIHLLPQFYQKQEFVYRRTIDGLILMGWGFFKKLVIADHLSVIVNNVYNNPTDFTGIPLWVATYFFAFQIYCDFSGYSDIAIGAAQVFGFDLMKNFRQPYFATSINDFWRRWHISLSTWFRDYLYVPLGGNRVSQWRWYSNMMVVFLVSGLWHGANWTFVVWGALHGIYAIISVVFARFWTNLPERSKNLLHPHFQTIIQIFLTFHLVCFAWIFFRANSLGDALYIVTHLFSGIEISRGYGLEVGGLYGLSIIVGAIALMEIVHLLQQQQSMREMLAAKPIWVRWGVYYALVISILMFGKFGITEFVYFQF